MLSIKSDHKIRSLTVEYGYNEPHESNIWKLNNSHLLEEDYKEKVTEIIRQT